MVRAVLRGVFGGILTAVYLYILLIFTYFNYNSRLVSMFTVFVLPLGCTVAAATFAEKERMSKFFVSAIFYVIMLLGLFFTAHHYSLLGYVFRILYGMPAEIVYESQTLAVLLMSAAGILLGLLIGFIAGIAGTVRIKKLIDSLEVPKMKEN